MLVVLTGYYPWSSAAPTDARFCQWLSAWRKLARVHPLASPSPAMLSLRADLGGPGTSFVTNTTTPTSSSGIPTQRGNLTGSSCAPRRGNAVVPAPGYHGMSAMVGGSSTPRSSFSTAIFDCESVGINSASPSSVSSRTTSPLQLFVPLGSVSESCAKSPPATPGGAAHGPTRASFKFPEPLPSTGSPVSHSGWRPSRLGDTSDRDVTYGLATLLHALTLPSTQGRESATASDSSPTDNSSSVERSGVSSSQRSSLETEPGRRALMQLIASMLNPDPAQRPGLTTVHQRFLEIIQAVSGVSGTTRSTM